VSKLPGARRTRSKGSGTGRGKGGANPAAPIPQATRTRAVEIYAAQGMAAAHAATGCAKSSIRRWALRVGVEAGNAAAVAQSAAATEVSLARRREATAAARATLIELQASIAIQASQVELAVLESVAAVAADQAVLRAPGPDEALPASLRRLQAILSGPRLSELVGAKTRAIHDLQLLDGQATEQPEGGLTVRFATPDPSALSAAPEPGAMRIVGPDMTVLELPAAPHRETA
jgi:hypothetical protein